MCWSIAVGSPSVAALRVFFNSSQCLIVSVFFLFCLQVQLRMCPQAKRQRYKLHKQVCFVYFLPPQSSGNDPKTNGLRRKRAQRRGRQCKHSRVCCRNHRHTIGLDETHGRRKQTDAESQRLEGKLVQFKGILHCEDEMRTTFWIYRLRARTEAPSPSTPFFSFSLFNSTPQIF